MRVPPDVKRASVAIAYTLPTVTAAVSDRPMLYIQQ